MAHLGRGRYYGPLRNLMEEALLRFYLWPPGAWATPLVQRLGLPAAVRPLHHRVTARAWPAGAPPLRIAFGSDFHAGPTTHPALLEAACAALREARPDLLLLGGDFIFLRAGFIDPLAEALGSIPAPLGRFAVLGNHDLWADDRHIVRVLEANGVEVLVNRPVFLPSPYAGVVLHGLDDPWVGRPDAAAAYAGTDGALARVVLMHAPAGLLFIGDRPFDVALCGHTHGGHIALPGGRPIVVPGPLSRRYPHGRHPVGLGERSTLLVSRGIGGVEVPLRLFADPDVLVCDLAGPAAP